MPRIIRSATPVPAVYLAILLLSAAPLSAQSFHSDAGIDFQVVELLPGLYHPWSIALVPPLGGDARSSGDSGGLVPTEAFITERRGRLYYVENLPKPGSETAGTTIDAPAVHQIRGLPPLVARRQGGLLDIILHPDYSQNYRIYFTLSAPGTQGLSGTAAYTAVFDRANYQLIDVELLYKMQRITSSAIQYGSRLAIGGDGALYISTGDRGEAMRAQNRDDSAGSILRVPLDADGRAAGPAGEFSYGHRNVEGMIYDPVSGDLLAHEHGPRGGDEINLIREGVNYGWPLVCYGINYNGTKVSDYHRLPGIAEPLIYWVPSIAPSGMARYPQTGVFAPAPGEGWSGNLLIGALAGKQIRRVSLPGRAYSDWPTEVYNGIAHEEVLIHNDFGRIRDVRVDTAGYIYFITDEDSAGLFRMEPVRRP